jgi:hypothetical protein
MKRICSIALLGLAACGTPQEQCISGATRDIRTVDRLISEVQGNLDRGFGYEYITVFELDYVDCGTEADPDRVCAIRVPEQERRPISLDLDAEQIKLNQLRAKRAQQVKSVAPVVAQCKIDNPE